ncbi:unnamed protein product [Leptidea sinapis]|uniref:Uncharacterized protein n=1 Tax=Leptidea sinapis TaxID=189913 RepID=A0A5E4QWN9_9NEOP|nr:unnamed protein product [Leptidea sinapis]
MKPKTHPPNLGYSNQPSSSKKLPEERLDIIPTIWMCGGPPQCGFQGSFFHVPQSLGMIFLMRCFRDDTTWVPSKKAPTPSLKAGNAPVIPLVLQENVCGGDHLTIGDPYARLSSYSQLGERLEITQDIAAQLIDSLCSEELFGLTPVAEFHHRIL